MLRLIAILVICLAVVAMLDATGRQPKLHVDRLTVSPIESELQRHSFRNGQPVALRAADGDSLAVELETGGLQTVGVLTVTGRGGRATLGLPGGRTLAAAEPDCTAAATGGWQCKVIWRADRPAERLPLYPADDAVTIDSVDFSPVTVLRSPATSFAGLLLFLTLLVLLAPLIGLIRWKSPALELPLLIGLSAAWIATTGMASALAIAAFLAIGYLFVRLELGAKGPYKDLDEGPQRSALLLVVGFVVVVLLYFKVLAPHAAAAFGQTSSLALPLGLSYFSIRLIDVMFAARARTLKHISAVEFLGFMLHPSMLAAGPITTIADFRQARIANWSVVDYGSGIARCLVGLIKKFSADLLLAPIVLHFTRIVAIHPESAQAWIVWPMLFGQLLYIYLDFTGYTDLALGTGRALGWRLPENFDLPLLRSNLQRFWRSWHMTLSNWVMRRVYFPAFIASRSPVLASICAMLTIGFWHQPGFGWTAWALHHGIGLGATLKFLEVAFRAKTPLARFAGTPAGRVVTAGLGWIFTMSWVALGLSYTLFDNELLSFAVLRGAFRF